MYSHYELSRVLADVRLRADPGPGRRSGGGSRRAVSTNQAAKRNGNALAGLIREALRPDKHCHPAADLAKDSTTQALSLAVLRVPPDGRVARAPITVSDSEAIARSEHLD